MPTQFDFFFMEPRCPLFDEENDPRIVNIFEDCDLLEGFLKDHDKLEAKHNTQNFMQIGKQISLVPKNMFNNRVDKVEDSISNHHIDIYQSSSILSRMDHIQAPSAPQNQNIEQWQTPSSSKMPIKKCQRFRGKYNILNQQYKRKIVEQTRSNTVIQVSKKYGVSVNNICRWRKRCDRRSGAGRKVTDVKMQQQLLQWIHSQPIGLTRKQIQVKARQFSSQMSFKASKGWFQRFFKRNKLSNVGNPTVKKQKTAMKSQAPTKLLLKNQSK